MSFIAVTYGYNMYSIFNIDCNTQPLIDVATKTCLDSLRQKLPERIKILERELDLIKADEESLHKLLAKLANDKLKEEERLEEVKKQEFSPDATKDSKKAFSKESRKIIKGKGKGFSNSSDNALQNIITEIEKAKNTLLTLKKNRDVYDDKKESLQVNLEFYKNLDETKIKIDFIDPNGNRVDLESKENSYVSTYLKDKDCYELALLNTSKS